jgi:hypothetical protein
MRSDTVGPWLDRDRLERRVRRFELAIAALRDRAVYRHAVTGTTPPLLDRAIKDFETDLAGVRQQLDELGCRG